MGHSTRDMNAPGTEEGTVLGTHDAGLGAVEGPVGAHHPNQPHLGAQPLPAWPRDCI